MCSINEYGFGYRCVNVWIKKDKLTGDQLRVCQVMDRFKRMSVGMIWI